MKTKMVTPSGFPRPTVLNLTLALTFPLTYFTMERTIIDEEIFRQYAMQSFALGTEGQTRKYFEWKKLFIGILCSPVIYVLRAFKIQKFKTMLLIKTEIFRNEMRGESNRGFVALLAAFRGFYRNRSQFQYWIFALNKISLQNLRKVLVSLKYSTCCIMFHQLAYWRLSSL